jgi:nucleotide-binding universal stress UspA family protein
MFKRILVAVDGSATANSGLKAAVELAADQAATVFVLHIVDDMAVTPTLDAAYIPSAYLERYVDALRETGRKTLAKAEAFARAQGVACKVVMVESLGQSIAQTILEQARKLRADVVVLGTHGRRGLARVLMGSDAEAVLREASVPVLLVRKSSGTSKPRAKVKSNGAGTRRAQARAGAARA